MSGSSVAGKGRAGEKKKKVTEKKAGNDERDGDGGIGEPGIARRFRSWLDAVAEAAVSCIVFSFLSLLCVFAFCVFVVVAVVLFEVLTGVELE